MDWPWPRWIAHRAGGNAAPENTLAGVPLAAACGFAAVEVDVRLAADGVPVVIHDDTLDRTCGRPGRVDAFDAQALGAIAADRGFEATVHAGATIPSLATLLRVVAAHRMRVNVELKCGREEPAALVAAVAQVITGLGWALAGDGVLLSAFEPPVLAEARRQLPRLPRALLCAGAAQRAIEAAVALECAALNVAAALCSSDLVSRAGRAGLPVCAWTVNDLAEAESLFGRGVAAVFSDRLDLAQVAASATPNP